jgi:methionyl-tRNA synthetase
MEKYYITTPIYYVNDEPHIGHAYTTIAADVMARYKRHRGLKVLFSTGTDEHAQKVRQAAEKRGLSPQEFVDQLASSWKRTFSFLEVEFDDFIRTSEARHKKVVQEFVSRLYAAGDIYKGYYEGWYCFWDEAFFPEAEVSDRKCPDCSRELQWMKEENYFFRLSRYNQPLLEHFLANPEFVEPEIRYNEMLNILKSGLKDISISRSTITWGVPLPFDQKHVVYVWVDALLNYITVAGWPDDQEKFSFFWPADVHLVGKEINRFHSIIWPAMLMAAGLPLPRKVFAHGFWTKEGQRISKSLGNVINPIKVVQDLNKFTGNEKVSVDVFRYFILREFPFGADGDFKDASLKLRYSADLANDLGNLLNRSIPLIEKSYQGVIPNGRPDQVLKAEAEKVVSKVQGFLDNIAYSDALTSIWEFLGTLNKYLDERAPWRLAKEGKSEELADVLYNVCEGLRFTALLIFPFMPTSAQFFWESLGLKGEIKNYLWDEELVWGKLPSGLQVSKRPPLFPRPEKEDL